jgi:predicted NBD/HSP70 family sugar kinase
LIYLVSELNLDIPMSPSHTSVRSQMKQSNQYSVLQLIQRRGPISRKDIVEVTGLSSSAVSNITGELIERGLVYEVGEADGEGRVGRPAILLRLKAHAGYVVGVKLDVRAIACVLTDLDANVLHVTETPLPFVNQANPMIGAVSPDDVIQATIHAVEHLLAIAQIDFARLLGIGVGVNGIVDADMGIARMAPHFGWRNVPLAAPLAAHFGIPVLLENDVRTLTIAEQLFGTGRDVDHFIAVAFGQGIGAGVVSHGVLLRGASNGAGEFGHIVIQPDGPRCSCGKHGCVESLAAEPAILRQVSEALAAGTSSVLASIQPLNLEAIARAADAGDTLARSVLSAAGRWLGIGIASLVNIVNPELMIINGEAVCGGRWYLEPMEAALRAHVFDGMADSLRILTEPGGNELWARGAACVILSVLFTPPVHQQETEPERKVRALALA